MLYALPDQNQFYDVIDAFEEQNMESIIEVSYYDIFYCKKWSVHVVIALGKYNQHFKDCLCHVMNTSI